MNGRQSATWLARAQKKAPDGLEGVDLSVRSRCSGRRAKSIATVSVCSARPLFHLREADEAHEHRRRGPCAHSHGQSRAAVRVAPGQGRKQVAAGGELEAELPVLIRGDDHSGVGDGKPGGRAARDREACRRIRVPRVTRRAGIADRPGQPNEICVAPMSVAVDSTAAPAEPVRAITATSVATPSAFIRPQGTRRESASLAVWSLGGGDDLRAQPSWTSLFQTWSVVQSSSVARRTVASARGASRRTGRGGALAPARSAAIRVATEPCGVARAPTARPIEAA